MSEFKWRQFEGKIILWAVRWYCRYGISYRDLEQMMGERGVSVDRSTIGSVALTLDVVVWSLIEGLVHVQASPFPC